MEHGSSDSRAFITSTVVFVVLAGAVFFFWNTFIIPPQHLKTALFFAVLFSSALIAVTVYQSYKISESAHSIAEGMTKDALTYSRELFSELYRGSPVPYVVITEGGLVESVNFATARFFHVEIDALHNLDIFSFIEGEDMQRIALIPEYFKQGKFVNDVEVQIRRPDGQLRWAMLSLFSFTDVHGERKGLLTLVDITKQKQIDKAKTEFVSLASHQLRTPISGMKWNIELLLTAGSDRLTSLQQKYVEKINAGLERMDLLVTDFLSVSKFELGTLVAEYTTVDLASFLQGICEEHAIGAEKRRVRIEAVWDENLGTARSDTHLLHMITSNLLSNAIKYTKEGGSVHLHASVRGGVFTYEVRDTGIGIPDEEQEMLFSKLFRASNARTQETDGTGLGLYIVKEAVTILGGKISFVSKVGAGTTFTVTLPT